jgi:hypothetical protein
MRGGLVNGLFLSDSQGSMVWSGNQFPRSDVAPFIPTIQRFLTTQKIDFSIWMSTSSIPPADIWTCFREG